jgi:protein-tyrosine phosphatase
MVAVLFVCTGNICRSPTAEGMFHSLLVRSGLQESVQVDSAGLQGYHIGDPPDPRTVEAARLRGIDLNNLRARQVRPADFSRFDLILAMDNGHLNGLRRLAPAGSSADIRLYLDFAGETLRGTEVPDPYYGPPQGFEQVLDLCEAAGPGLLSEVHRRLARQAG